MLMNEIIGFLFRAKKQLWRLDKYIESDFHSGLFWCSSTEKKNTEVGLSSSQEMCILSFDKWA